MSSSRSAWVVMLLLAAPVGAHTCFAEATSDEGIRACVTMSVEPQGDAYDLLPTCVLRFECDVEPKGGQRTQRWHHEVETICGLGGPVVADVRWNGSDVVVAVVFSGAPNVRLKAWQFGGAGVEAARAVAEVTWDTKLYDFSYVAVRILADAVLVEASVGAKTWRGRAELEPAKRTP